MKFDCGETWEEKSIRLSKWHRFFAIWPRRVADHDCRCFEWIERRGVFWDGWDWEYRAILQNSLTKAKT